MSWKEVFSGGVGFPGLDHPSFAFGAQFRGRVPAVDEAGDDLRGGFLQPGNGRVMGQPAGTDDEYALVPRGDLPADRFAEEPDALHRA